MEGYKALKDEIKNYMEDMKFKQDIKELSNLASEINKLLLDYDIKI